jgi:hypothetical protein
VANWVEEDIVNGESVVEEPLVVVVRPAVRLVVLVDVEPDKSSECDRFADFLIRKRPTRTGACGSHS